MTTTYNTLNSMAIQRCLSSPVEEGRSSSVGRHRPRREDHGGLRALGFTNVQISKKELVVRHIGKYASVLYEFRKPVDLKLDF